MQPAWASRSVSCVWIFSWFSFRSRLYAFATQVILSCLPLSCLFRSKTIIHMVFHISVTQTLSTSQFTMCPGQYILERECVCLCVFASALIQIFIAFLFTIWQNQKRLQQRLVLRALHKKKPIASLPIERKSERARPKWMNRAQTLLAIIQALQFGLH